MRHSPLRIAFAALLGATLFVGGMLTERFVGLSPDHQTAVGTHQSNSSARIDKMLIQGQGLIMAYHANGTRFAVWQGHNSLMGGTVNSLVGCITGANPAPLNQSPCSGWVTGIYVLGLNSGQTGAAATNTLTPAGCFPVTTTSPNCTGWQSTATIDFALTTPFAIYSAGAGCGANQGGPASTTCQAAFDLLQVNPPISVQAGDRVIVTITFTVS